MTAPTKTKGKTSAILESISAATPAPAAAAPAAVSASPEFDWDSLPAVEVAVYSRSAPSRDLEALTPAAVKNRVTSGFEATAKAGKPTWFVQECGTAERAEEFLKLARRYATFRGYTLRGKANPNALSEIRYTVKVREARKSTNK